MSLAGLDGPAVTATTATLAAHYQKFLGAHRATQAARQEEMIALIAIVILSVVALILTGDIVRRIRFASRRKVADKMLDAISGGSADDVLRIWRKLDLSVYTYDWGKDGSATKKLRLFTPNTLGEFVCSVIHNSISERHRLIENTARFLLDAYTPKQRKSFLCGLWRHEDVKRDVIKAVDDLVAERNRQKLAAERKASEERGLKAAGTKGKDTPAAERDPEWTRR